MDARFDHHVKLNAVEAHLLGCLEMLSPRWNHNQMVAETDFCQFEGGTIHIGIEQIANRHLMRRCGGFRIILEVDPIGQDIYIGYIVSCAVTRRANQFVGISGIDHTRPTIIGWGDRYIRWIFA